MRFLGWNSTLFALRCCLIWYWGEFNRMLFPNVGRRTLNMSVTFLLIWRGALSFNWIAIVNNLWRRGLLTFYNFKQLWYVLNHNLLVIFPILWNLLRRNSIFISPFFFFRENWVFSYSSYADPIKFLFNRFRVLLQK